MTTPPVRCPAVCSGGAPAAPVTDRPSCAKIVVNSVTPSGLVAATGGRAVIVGSVFLVVGRVGVAELADGAGFHLRKGEGVGPVHAQMLAHERAQPCGVFLA
jgi:hypothetical protein